MKPLKEIPYWWETVPVPIRPADGAADQQITCGRRFDVAIVGAGYTGLSAARTLARRGASVVVIEREQIGWGASSRNGGQVLTGLRLDPAALVSRFGERGAGALFDISLEAIASLEALITSEGIACEYERTGHLHAAARPSHFAALREEQALLMRLFGHRVDLVGKADQRSELGSDAYHGLLVDSRSAALNPAQYVRGLAVSAAQAGAVIVEGTAVTRVERLRKRWRLTTATGAAGRETTPVEAMDVLMATNGYVDKAAPALQRRFVPLGSYIIATDPLGADLAASLLPRRRMAFDSKHFLHYFRLTGDNRLLFGGRAVFGRPTPRAAGEAAAILRQDMVGLFPELSGAGTAFAWGGTVALTRDEMPHAGCVDGMYFAGGYCGHGIAMATYLGALIARRIAGDTIDHPLVNDRFPPIPLYYGRPWFLPIMGAWYRVLDLIG